MTDTPDSGQATAVAPVVLTADPLILEDMRGGVTVTITGSGFSEATAVQVGDRAAQFVIEGDTRLRLTAPDYSDYTPTSSFGVYVTTTHGTNTDVGQAIIQYGTLPDAGGSGGDAPAPQPTGPAPTVATAAPTQVDDMRGGTMITVTGTGFTGTTRTHIGDRDASYILDSDTQLRIVAPDFSDYTAGSSFGVYVTTANGVNTDCGQAIIQFGTAATTPAAPAPTGPAPQVTSASPLTLDDMHGGVTISVTGTGFTGATQVTVGNRPAGFAVDSDTALRLTAPDFSDYTPSSSFGVQVTTPNGTNADSGEAIIQYGAAPAAPDPGPGATQTGPAPTVSSASPTHLDSTQGGATVTVTGSGFTGATRVTVGDRDALFAVDSDTQLRLTAPDFSDYTPSSSFGVRVTTPNGTNADSGDAIVQYGDAPES